MNKTKQNLGYAVTWATLMFAFTMLVVSAWWLLSPYRVLEIGQPPQILNKGGIINVGDAIELKIDYKKSEPLPSSVSPAVSCESGNLVQFNNFESNLPVGEGTTLNTDFILPPKFEEGDNCQVVLAQTYKVNPLREITYTIYSEFFIVGKDTIHQKL